MIPTAAGCFNGMSLAGPKEFTQPLSCFGYLPKVRSLSQALSPHDRILKLFCLGFGINFIHGLKGKPGIGSLATWNLTLNHRSLFVSNALIDSLNSMVHLSFPLLFMAKVSADDTNQDRMRSMICVFRALRLYAGEFDPPLSHWVLVVCWFYLLTKNLHSGLITNQRVVWKIRRQSFCKSIIAFLHQLDCLSAPLKDRDLQRQGTASIKHAITLANGKRVDKLVQNLGLA